MFVKSLLRDGQCFPFPLFLIFVISDKNIYNLLILLYLLNKYLAKLIHLYYNIVHVEVRPYILL